MQQVLFDHSIKVQKEELAWPETVLSSEIDSETVGPYEVNHVYNIDCIGGMKALGDESVDIAIADPPYNLSKGGNWKWDNSVKLSGFGGNWNKVMANWDDMSFDEYLKFTETWLRELKRVVKRTGSIWIHGTYHNMGIINVLMQLLQIEMINEVVWFKRNSFPNLSGRRLTASHETLLWAHTGGSKDRKYFFNYDAAKAMSCPEDMIKEPGKQMRTVWDIPNNKDREEIKHGKHPTQKPIRLLKRMLKISAKKGHLLLSPFAGSGSDCVAAKQLGIKFIGFDVNKSYVDICNKRLGILEEVQPSRKDQEIAVHVGESKNVWHSPRKAVSIPSLIKWTGSKRSQALRIAELIPSYKRYFEPFLGGGALLFLTATHGCVAGDSYAPLIALWKLIQNEPEMVVRDYEQKWLGLQNELSNLDRKAIRPKSRLPEYYYLIRNRFNQNRDPLDLNFIMRTCVNGIVRFNDKGEFNNSFHLSRNGMEPERFEKAVKAWNKILQGVRLVCNDYSETVSDASEGDLVYFDPPYAGNRQRYSDQVQLDSFFHVLKDLNNRGVKWILSFDGWRGSHNLTHPVPPEIYSRHLYLMSGNSAVKKVLSGPIEAVSESVYLNY